MNQQIRFTDTVARYAAVILATTAVLTFALSVSLAQSPPATSDQIKAHAKEILSQPEFQAQSDQGPFAEMGRTLRQDLINTATWFRNRWESINRWWRHLFGGFGGRAGGAATRAVPYAFVILFCGGIAWLIAWLIRSYVAGRIRRQAQLRTAFDEAELEEGLVLEPQVWLNQSETYANEGDYRRAFRAVFVAILLFLDSQGLIEYDKSRTNGEYLRLLKRTDEKQLIATMDRLIVEFDRRWYGRAETDKKAFDAIRKTFEGIRSQLTDAPAATTLASAEKA